MRRLDARRRRLALEVQRDRDADLLVLQHALQVDMQHGVLRRMPLHVFQHGSLAHVADLQVEDRRVEPLIVQHDEQPGVIERQRARLTMAT